MAGNHCAMPSLSHLIPASVAQYRCGSGTGTQPRNASLNFVSITAGFLFGGTVTQVSGDKMY